MHSRLTVLAQRIRRGILDNKGKTCSGIPVPVAAVTQAGNVPFLMARKPECKAGLKAIKQRDPGFVEGRAKLIHILREETQKRKAFVLRCSYLM